MHDKSEYVVLVNDEDEQLGIEGKLEAHRRGALHRAFSIYVFDPNGALIMQKRAASKYHSGGLWTNTCCSHPREGEDVLEAAHRRLKEEMGFDCTLEKLFETTYEARLDKGMTEHEFLHVFVGTYNGAPAPDPEEVDEHKGVRLSELEKNIIHTPEHYTEWLKICFPMVVDHIKNHSSFSRFYT